MSTSKISSAGEKLLDSVKNNQVSSQLLDAGGKIVNSFLTKDQGLSNKKEILIARPSVYHNSIDPNHRISNFFKNRMAIIDLMPCHYQMKYTCPTPIEKEMGITGISPEIVYDDQMGKFYDSCDHYGLPPGHFLRIFSTEETNASDQLTNSLDNNWFQDTINQQSKRLQQLRQIVHSFDQTGSKKAANALNDLVQGGADALKDFIGQYETDSDISGTLINAAGKAASVALDVIGKGHRVSLPKIWNESTYSPNLIVNLKLISPYGHPAAIKEFIIKPLMYLLILASPETSDGISYGHPTFVTVKAYGLGYAPIGIISDLTLRRGGNDLSFNIYKQPLSISVSLNIEFATSGFAHYLKDPKYNRSPERGMFHEASLMEADFCQGDNPIATVPTLGHIIRSLKPREVTNDNFSHQSSMEAIRNTKPNASGSPMIRPPGGGSGFNLSDFNPLSAMPKLHSELRSAMTSAVSSTANMIKQGVSNKVGSLFS